MRSFDACNALSPDRAAILGPLRKVPFTPPAGSGSLPDCQWQHRGSEPEEVYVIEPATSFDFYNVERYPPGSPVFTISGFNAITGLTYGNDPKSSCQIAIDVMENQALGISYTYWGKIVPMNHDIACQKARKAAELVMTTLLDS